MARLVLLIQFTLCFDAQLVDNVLCDLGDLCNYEILGLKAVPNLMTGMP